MFYYLVLQWVLFIAFTFNFLQIEGYLRDHFDLKRSLLFYGFWTLVLSLIVFSVWRNKKTVYQSLHKTMPSLFYSVILGTIVSMLPTDAHFFIFVGLAIWMIHLANAEHAEHTDKKRIAFILVNIMSFYLVITGITLAYISDILTYVITFLVLVFYLFSAYKMYPNSTITKYNISALFLSFLIHLLPYTYTDVFNQFLRIDPVDTMSAFSILLIVPTLILVHGYFRKTPDVNPVILTKKHLVLLWLLTFGVPIIGFIIFFVMEGLAGLSY